MSTDPTVDFERDPLTRELREIVAAAAHDRDASWAEFVRAGLRDGSMEMRIARRAYEAGEKRAAQQQEKMA